MIKKVNKREALGNIVIKQTNRNLLYLTCVPSSTLKLNYPLVKYPIPMAEPAAEPAVNG